ncbi:5,10-methylenetetrahydrofolate reductase [Nitrospina gracilis 3/211]|uniref:Methylenetetrahydrofolate reductase n=1 Tax=Nitrospina gracilis (strain 3/211) TaxID=1266370 RepID=M1YW24_NITG3|nr:MULTISPECIES: methylenetetrahydrofolate reductase [NAD(P)H] [Nitrospina]MCF8724326.1 methylenetetrahydrofolate reductase (NADPH) [Nitrospina sp. Nb-3]CCQ89519.1 5,10-methylenetetrahydrofolate reductase [Nitrospina gracilis 3/211]
MKISKLIETIRPAFSFEFFPPKDDEGFNQLFTAIENLKPCQPVYVSVTYGAMGNTRTKTLDLVKRIKRDLDLESMAHLTCVGSNSDEIAEVLDALQDAGIENVLALRGDPPKDQEYFVRPKDGFGFANELVEFIKKRGYDFCIGVAGYPEKHIECSDMNTDLDNLKRKVDAGADFVVTQLFFDNDYYFDFVDRAIARGINVPIIPGIMPIQNLKQVKRFTKMCGSTIPDPLLLRMEAYSEDTDAIKEIGVEHATEQCEGLINGGAPGIHFYTLNRSRATLNIFENLKKLVDITPNP